MLTTRTPSSYHYLRGPVASDRPKGPLRASKAEVKPLAGQGRTTLLVMIVATIIPLIVLVILWLLADLLSEL